MRPQAVGGTVKSGKIHGAVALAAIDSSAQLVSYSLLGRPIPMKVISSIVSRLWELLILLTYLNLLTCHLDYCRHSWNSIL
jgi:hypothetical protein